MKPYKIIISGGGTGGHLYPALAIADEFQSYNTAEILFVGALGRIEMDRFQSQDIELLVFGLMVFKGLYQLEI